MLLVLSFFLFNFYLVFFSRLIDLTTRHRAETEMETERLRSAQMQAERMLEARERANRQKIKGLEETVSNMLAKVKVCTKPKC